MCDGVCVCAYVCYILKYIALKTYISPHSYIKCSFALIVYILIYCNNIENTTDDTILEIMQFTMKMSFVHGIGEGVFQ